MKKRNLYLIVFAILLLSVVIFIYLQHESEFDSIQRSYLKVAVNELLLLDTENNLKEVQTSWVGYLKYVFSNDISLFYKMDDREYAGLKLNALIGVFSYLQDKKDSRLYFGINKKYNYVMIFDQMGNFYWVHENPFGNDLSPERITQYFLSNKWKKHNTDFS
jgi:hypothetical protein